MGIHGEYRLVVIVSAPLAEHTGRSKCVAIVGAGPAGLFAAEHLAGLGYTVAVYERMPAPARKFLMAGRGGLNLTHSESLETFLARYHDPEGMIGRAVRAFPPSALIAWANGLGAETFVGSSGRVFPKAMKASPLLRAWLRRLDGLGVILKTGWTWHGFGKCPTHLLFDTPQGAQTVTADAVLLALGGASWPRLGSDGTWVAILKQADVAITPLSPSNCGISVPWSPHMAKHAGSPLKRIAVTCGQHTQKGEAVITRTGLEGGALYALSHATRAALEGGPALIHLDLRPDLSLEDLTRRIQAAPAKSTWSNLLRKAGGLSPSAAAIVREAGAIPRAASELAARIKNVPVRVLGLSGLERAISTAGGIKAESVDDRLMLKMLPGVFVAGEMLDFDAPTGGYLLQAAFASGRLAAEGIAFGSKPIKQRPGQPG